MHVCELKGHKTSKTVENRIYLSLDVRFLCEFLSQRKNKDSEMAITDSHTNSGISSGSQTTKRMNAL